MAKKMKKKRNKVTEEKQKNKFPKVLSSKVKSPNEERENVVNPTQQTACNVNSKMDHILSGYAVYRHKVLFGTSSVSVVDRNANHTTVTGNGGNTAFEHSRDISEYKINSNQSLSKRVGQKPFQCDVCGKSFGLKIYLTKHCKTHTSDKPFSCNVCGRAFRLKKYLVDHFKAHTGEKPYVCSACGKAFAKNCHLVEHCRMHTGEKPYVCSACGKAFAKNCHLVEHCRTHTGEKPYVCNACGKAFAKNRQLVKHGSTHSNQ